MNIERKKNIEYAPVFFTDFDGTITKQDLGDELFRTFGTLEPHRTLLLEGKLKIHDYWKCLCQSLPENISSEDIRRYALDNETDSYFEQFANWCKSNNFPLAIVSDGFDTYIKPVLEKLSLEWLPTFCNKMVFSGNSHPEPVYTNSSESCDCLVASCKRNSILLNVPENAVFVYIGDGYSDFCPAEHSDIVFAKGNLAAYCNEKRIPHYPFSNFFDVYVLVQKIIKENKFKPRHQALLLRKKAFETE